MQIPPLKKSTFYIIIALVVLVGFILGALFSGYLFNKYRDRVCVLTEPPKVSKEITQNQIANATSLASDKIISGKVISKEANGLSMEITLNSIEATASGTVKNSTTTAVNVPFDQQKDQVIILKQVPTFATPSAPQNVSSSFNEIKVGQQIIVKILGGKKTIYITSS
ncbi:MAG: hypothetical protein Q8O66_01095 [bacterium]|nr:hypothetical protein [bacterium]